MIRILQYTIMPHLVICLTILRFALFGPRDPATIWLSPYIIKNLRKQQWICKKKSGISRWKQMGNTVSKLHAKFHQASLTIKRSNGRHKLLHIGTSKNGKVHIKDSKTKKIDLKNKLGFLKKHHRGIQSSSYDGKRLFMNYHKSRSKENFRDSVNSYIFY